MEATSARMARDRFGGFTEPATTPLQRYIQNACDPQNFQPNIALNMEIVDMVNAKKGSSPREAAIAIVTHINNRNPNISMLALNLLDNCVKNCGYPFHLQISTKEFLNELVRRFPERPPFRYSRVQNKILELIEEWRSTICQTSKYKEDLGFIRDMHRLLSYKGYMFPEVTREDAAVLNPSDTLQSAEEMEEEERAAQSAKLQELIRRGTPHDLQEANKLMKVMAGYDLRNKTNYRAKAAEEVSKVQQKARILEEMLQQHKPGDDMTDDTWEELGNALASAQPKIQKMCEEESDDHEAVAKLFEINDSIHRTLERYRLTKKGDIEGAAKIPQGTLGASGAGVRQGAGGELSLIDFGGPEDQDDSLTAPAKGGQASSANGNGSSLENDLLGLSMQDGPSISLGGPSISSANTPSQPKRSNADILSAFSASSTPTTQTSFTKPSLQQPRPAQPPSDPFGSLSSARTASPANFQSSIASTPSHAPSNSVNLLGDLGGFDTPPSVPSKAPAVAPRQSVDDEWTFSSSLPSAPSTTTLTVIDNPSSITVLFTITRSPQSDGSILIQSSISNNTSQLISDLTFQLAVMKGYTLALQPQSGRNLTPKQRDGITQQIRVQGHVPGNGKPVKCRWKAAYRLGTELKEEMGEVADLGLG